MVEERCHPTLHTNNERPPAVRRSRTDLRARVNGDLQLEFTDIALTSYAGLELFSRYLRATRFNAVVREACAGASAWGDFGAVAMVRLHLSHKGAAGKQPISNGLVLRRKSRGLGRGSGCPDESEH